MTDVLRCDKCMLRVVPAQQLSELSDEMVRLAAAKDAEIANWKREHDILDAFIEEQLAEIARLRNTIGWEASVAYRAEIAALTADRDRWMADNKRLGQALINMNPALSQIATLTEQRDRAMKVVEVARAYRGGTLDDVLAAFDAEAAVKTAPSLPETPEG